jgi:hypothetical protein
MLSAQVNRETIATAQPGSDLYGLLEKTALRISSLKNRSDSVANWFDAQNNLSEWLNCTHYDQKSPEQHAHKVISVYADRYKESGDSIDKIWKKGQTDIANLISLSYSLW